MKTIYLIASGDLRLSANQKCQEAQAAMEAQLTAAVERAGAQVRRAHSIEGGWAGASSERQPAMYFHLGGGTLKGVSKPGWIVWSRVYVENETTLKFDTGLAEVVALPEERWRETTPQWPIMHTVLQGVSRDQIMGRHAANHIQGVYAPDKEGVRKGLFAKAAAMAELGLDVAVCGSIRDHF